MTCVSAHDIQLTRLANAIAQRVGPQRFHVWFNNSTRLDLRQDGLEIAVPNDFISEWIGRNFSRPIQEAAHEVLGCPLPVRFNVSPKLFETDCEGSFSGFGSDVEDSEEDEFEDHPGASLTLKTKAVQLKRGAPSAPVTVLAPPPAMTPPTATRAKTPPARALSVPSSSRGVPEPRTESLSTFNLRSPLRHDLAAFITGPTNQLAYNTACYVSEFPGSQYNPLFIHGECGLGKTHLLQGLSRKFIEHHPTKRWLYLTGEEFTNEFLSALRNNKLDAFRRKMRDLDLLVIDDVHFLAGKKATQEEFLHTFNAIEALGKQVVMASDSHPKLIEEFGESLVNRFVSGMVVRIDPPNFSVRCDILRSLSNRLGLGMSDEVIAWVARRVTTNVRELEGAITRINAQVRLNGGIADIAVAQAALGDVHRQHVNPIRPENVLQAVCTYFGLELKDLMSGRRQRTISLARSLAMFLIRRNAKLSFPEIGSRMGKRNHSTVISACRRIEQAIAKNASLTWTSSVGEREEEATELVQRLEEQSRSIG